MANIRDTGMQVSAYVTLDEAEALRKAAVREDRTVASIVRRLVRQYLSTIEQETKA